MSTRRLQKIPWGSRHQEQMKTWHATCLLPAQIHFEVSEIARAFRDFWDTVGSFDLASFLTRCLAGVICNMSFGKRYSQNASKFLLVLQVSRQVMQTFRCSNAAELFPAFHYPPDNKLRGVFTCVQNKERYHEQKYSGTLHLPWSGEKISSQFFKNPLLSNNKKTQSVTFVCPAFYQGVVGLGYRKIYHLLFNVCFLHHLPA